MARAGDLREFAAGVASLMDDEVLARVRACGARGALALDMLRAAADVGRLARDIAARGEAMRASRSTDEAFRDDQYEFLRRAADEIAEGGAETGPLGDELCVRGGSTALGSFMVLYASVYADAAYPTGDTRARAAIARLSRYTDTMALALLPHSRMLRVVARLERWIVSECVLGAVPAPWFDGVAQRIYQTVFPAADACSNSGSDTLVVALGFPGTAAVGADADRPACGLCGWAVDTPCNGGGGNGSTQFCSAVCAATPLDAVHDPLRELVFAAPQHVGSDGSVGSKSGLHAVPLRIANRPRHVRCACCGARPAVVCWDAGATFFCARHAP